MNSARSHVRWALRPRSLSPLHRDRACPISAPMMRTSGKPDLRGRVGVRGMALCRLERNGARKRPLIPTFSP
jgi:hypothetical protein